jgi:hypothetical protein
MPAGDLPVMTKATIHVPGLKVAVPLAADALRRDLVPMDGPAGEPILELVLGGSPLTARARLNPGLAAAEVDLGQPVPTGAPSR